MKRMSRVQELLARASVLLPLLLPALLVALGWGGSPAAAVAAVALTALLIAALGSAVVARRPRFVAVGSRDRSRREPVAAQVEPAHPDTAGRVRSRAPGRMLPAA
jgi:hypothetical protein